MNQIPSDSIYCGECIRVKADLDFCPVYRKYLTCRNIGNGWQWKRLPECLHDRSMIMTARALEVIIKGSA